MRGTPVGDVTITTVQDVAKAPSCVDIMVYSWEEGKKVVTITSEPGKMAFLHH
jgi:hypothetical protein